MVYASVRVCVYTVQPRQNLKSCCVRFVWIHKTQKNSLFFSLSPSLFLLFPFDGSLAVRFYCVFLCIGTHLCVLNVQHCYCCRCCFASKHHDAFTIFTISTSFSSYWTLLCLIFFFFFFKKESERTRTKSRFTSKNKVIHQDQNKNKCYFVEFERDKQEKLTAKEINK